MQLPFFRFTVSGSSMFPALKHGQDVLIWCWFYQPKVGDIVVLEKNGKEIVKRIKSIKENQISVEGDNRKQSTDSRSFGPVSRAEIVGKVVYVR